MSEGKTDQGYDGINLTVTANLLGLRNEEQAPKGVVYAFSSGGRLLNQQSLDEQGNASLTLPRMAEAQEVRVVVGPPMEQPERKEQSIRIADLLRRGGEELRLRIDPDDLRPSITIPVFPDRWRCWLLGLCFVRGSVVKRVGFTDFPICDATVEIYEVDPIHILIPRLPDLVIERIRDVILNPPPPEERFRRRFPPPPPPPELRPTERPALRLSAVRTPELALQMEGSLVQAAQQTAVQTLSAATDLQFVARTASTFQLRDALIANASHIRHILCLFDPTFVTMQLVATAQTDRCGRFRTFFSRGCNNPDVPDLYFKVKQQIFPFVPPVTIYAPTPVACYTRWNYVCGSEVMLAVTSPLAIACPPCPSDNIPEKGVVVKAIGNTLLNQMYGTSTTSPQPVTDANRGLLHDGRPWGGTLRLRLDFDPALRANNIKYYRVSYRKGTTGTFQPLTDEIHRYYTTFGPPPAETLYSLGPQTVPPVTGTPKLFEIPPELPPVVGAAWTMRDVVEEVAHAEFPTGAIAPGVPLNQPSLPDNAGKYQLKVDLFDNNGQLVDIAAQGINYYVPTDTDPAPAAPLGLVIDDDADGLMSFVMTVHVDNNPCDARIDPPQLNGTPASATCGILEYSRDPAGNPLGSVAMPFMVYHRNGFATYSFRLERGANPQTLPPPPATATLPMSGPVPAGSTTLTNSQTVSDLLGGCPAAGFAAYLYVDAIATDGWTSELGYDASDVFGFAIAPTGLLSGGGS